MSFGHGRIWPLAVIVGSALFMMTPGNALIDMDEAYRCLFDVIKPGRTVESALADASYRTLALPVCCDLDNPPFDRATMDGYAVRAADTADAPVTLRVTGSVPAGAVPDRAIHALEAVQINTGAPIPLGADAVVRVENTVLTKAPSAISDQASASGPQPQTPTRNGECNLFPDVVIQESVPPGRFITRRATYATAGTTVLEAGTLLTPIDIGTAATAGAARVTVYRRPTVAVLSTGDELVDIDRTPSGAQIRNSNQYMVESLVRSAHAEPISLEQTIDSPEALRSSIEEGLNSDVLCITGGISMGAFDFVPDILRDCGAKFYIRKLAIKPGRPTIFAIAPNGSLIFALPGNPMGAFVVFELLVRPALAALEGRPGTVPKLLRAVLLGTIEPTTDRRSYRPVRARLDDDGQWVAEPLSWHGSGDSLGGATANALCMRPPRAGQAKSGDIVRIMLLDRV